MKHRHATRAEAMTLVTIVARVLLNLSVAILGQVKVLGVGAGSEQTGRTGEGEGI